jgi:hypothetical protein
MNLVPSHASLRIDSHTTLDNLQVVDIDWFLKIITVLVPSSETESTEQTYRLSDIESLTFPNCVNELV